MYIWDGHWLKPITLVRLGRPTLTAQDPPNLLPLDTPSGGGVNAQASITFAPLTVSSTATVEIEAQASITFDALTVDATAKVTVDAQAAITFGALVAASEADVIVKAQASITFDPLTVNATAAVTIKAQASITFDPMTVSGELTVTTIVVRMVLAPYIIPPEELNYVIEPEDMAYVIEPEELNYVIEPEDMAYVIEPEELNYVVQENDMPPPIYTKHPSAVIVMTWDWRRWLKPGVTVASYDVTVTGCTLDSDSISSGVVTATISGGTEGATAIVTCWVTNSASPSTKQYRTRQIKISSEV